MNTAILLSGGKGLRMGSSTPKQYICVSGKLLITYCMETLLAHPMIDAIQVVAEDEWKRIILNDLKKGVPDIEKSMGKIHGFSAPGTDRQSSIFHALRDLEPFIRCGSGGAHNAVLIHDAVRPNLTAAQITACFKALKDHDGAMPVLPMKDTVYLSDGGSCVSKLVDRDKLFAGQAPEVFDFEKYYAANLRLLPDGFRKIKGSAEPAVMAGLDVAMIPGDEDNYKITTKADLKRFRKQREEECKRNGE